MMEQVKEAFPGYLETEFLETLYKAIDNKEMLRAYVPGSHAGIPKTECGEADVRYRYHSCGFVDDEELVAFDYPCQRVVLKAEQIKG